MHTLHTFNLTMPNNNRLFVKIVIKPELQTLEVHCVQRDENSQEISRLQQPAIFDLKVFSPFAIARAFTVIQDVGVEPVWSIPLDQAKRDVIHTLTLACLIQLTEEDLVEVEAFTRTDLCLLASVSPDYLAVLAPILTHPKGDRSIIRTTTSPADTSVWNAVLEYVDEHADPESLTGHYLVAHIASEVVKGHIPQGFDQITALNYFRAALRHHSYVTSLVDKRWPAVLAAINQTKLLTGQHWKPSLSTASEMIDALERVNVNTDKKSVISAALAVAYIQQYRQDLQKVDIINTVISAMWWKRLPYRLFGIDPWHFPVTYDAVASILNGKVRQNLHLPPFY